MYAVSAVDASYPYTVTLDSPYGSDTQSDCELFRQGSVGGGVSGYQYIVTFDSNVGDLSALTVDGSGLSDSSYENATTAEVRTIAEKVKTRIADVIPAMAPPKGS